MPSFAFPPLPHQLPPTPPEYVPGYPFNGCGNARFDLPPYARDASMNGCCYEKKSRYDFGDQYFASTFARGALPAYDPNPIQTSKPYHMRDTILPQSCQKRFDLNSVVTMPPMNNVHKPRVNDVVQQQAQAKEEKPVGGVAVHLDYEMEQMSDFVSEMAQGIVHPGSSVSPQFRKYVLQILSSTRLPSSTILLSLYYLAKRMRQLSADGTFKTSTAQMYRMLTTSLVLGSKFLDDNTFQNRSWSEVSNIPVADLNALEMEWLIAIDWKLHVDPNEPNGLMDWRDHWLNWQKQAAAKSTESRTLAPLDASIRRHGSQQHTFSTESAFSRAVSSFDRQPPAAFQPQMRYECWVPPQTFSEQSPPSAPPTGPTTPEYYAAAGWGYANPAPPPYSARGTTPTFQTPSQPPSYHQTPYVPSYLPNIWNGHGAGCRCMHCLRPQDHFLLGHRFSLQTVAS